MSAAPHESSGLRQLIGVFGFEWQYQTRRLSYVASVLLLVFAATALVTTGFGPGSLAINGAYIVTESMAAYKVCQTRIDAVDKALKEALRDVDGAERPGRPAPGALRSA